MPAASATEKELVSRESKKTFKFYNECEFVWACVACQTDTLHILLINNVVLYCSFDSHTRGLVGADDTVAGIAVGHIL